MDAPSPKMPQGGSADASDKPQARKRDPRVDVLRGLALLMIFIDHIPRNAPALFTLHNLSLSDAAELFVLLAGYSSMVAYGGLFRRAGVATTLLRIAKRCLRIYLFQAGLLIATLLIVRAWMEMTGLVPRFGVKPLLEMGMWQGMLRGLALNALPNYLDILPLYIVLLASFPLVYLGMKKGIWGTLALSATIWLAANVDHHLNLPNAAADDGWYFNPFAWQFLFVIGCALAVAVRNTGGYLPRHPTLVALALAYLVFSFFQAGAWGDWDMPDLHPLAIEPPNKSYVPPLRLINILALGYLLFSSPAVRRLSERPFLRAAEACGKHSLEIFAVGCLCALIGRILYRTFEPVWPLQIAVNLSGLSLMLGLGLYFEARAGRRAARAKGVA